MGGFRPFTEYTCTIVATNSQGSGPPASSTTMTNEDGECICILAGMQSRGYSAYDIFGKMAPVARDMVAVFTCGTGIVRNLLLILNREH